MTSPSLIKQGKEWGYGLNSQDPLISFSKKKKKSTDSFFAPTLQSSGL